jgi:hypothetical protein
VGADPRFDAFFIDAGDLATWAMSAVLRLLLLLGTSLSLTVLAFPLTSGQPEPARAKDCLAGTWADEEGNEYSFRGSSGACAPSYTIKGKLYFSTEFQGLPWKLSGSGQGTSFGFEIIPSSSGYAHGYCPIAYRGTVSGSPPTESAIGTYSEPAPCSESGIFYMTQQSD